MMISPALGIRLCLSVSEVERTGEEETHSSTLHPHPSDNDDTHVIHDDYHGQSS